MPDKNLVSPLYLLFRFQVSLLFLCLLVCLWTGCHGDIGDASGDVQLQCPNGCLCDESRRHVNCSNGNWSYIPPVPGFAAVFIFENNSLHSIDEATLDNLTIQGATIVYLSLSGNSIGSYTGNAFASLRHLHTLHIDRVSHNYSMFMEMFKDLNTLEHFNTLSLSRNRLKHRIYKLPEGFFEPLRNSNLTRLYLQAIGCHEYDHSDFLPLRNLQHLDLGHNGIRDIRLATSDTLQKLILTDNRIVYLPDFCHNNSQKHVYFKNLRLLFLNENLIYDVVGFKISCLSELRNISLADNVIHHIKRNTFAHFPHLDSLFLYSMRISWLSLADYALNNSNVKSIFLFNNKINFLRDISSSAFFGCKHLQNLDISHNGMMGFTPKHFSKMFGRLSKLVYLHMTACHLDSVPFDTLAYFPRLHTLDVSWNNLQEIDGYMFWKLRSLAILDVSFNRIQSVDEEAFHPVFDRLQHINFANNSFACDCSLLWFKQYLSQASRRISMYPYGYTCSTPQAFRHQTIDSVPLSTRTCMVSHMASVILMVTIGACVLLLLGVSLGWRYRWHLHFLLLVLERRHSRRRPAASSHDYYVSADMDSESDRPWVLEELMPRVLDFGVSAISSEDTTPGHPEFSSALDAMMNRCQRVLFVLSNDYAQSDRCQFELSLALRASLDFRREDITIILLEPLEPRYVTNSIKVLLKEFFSVPWPGDDADLEEARGHFWDTLRSALAHDADTV